MANFNYKNKFTKWATQLGLCLIASVGPVNAKSLKEINTDDLRCLIQNGYFEARSDGYASVMGVTNVVLNRTYDPRYPNSICEVVYQGPTDSKGNPLRHQCQFSWYCDGRSDRMVNEELIDMVQIVVRETLALWYNNIDITEGATHYHAKYVNPTWAKTLNYTTQIGTHKYYRWN
jgi:spore germination cell wall hydrolase CwlJ-like protein